MDRNRPNRPRPSRPPAQPPRGAENAPAAPRAIPPTSYREHLESDHGVRVVEEKGWPTEVMRYLLVRDKNGREETMETFQGTLPQALSHYYHMFHPQPSR